MWSIHVALLQVNVLLKYQINTFLINIIYCDSITYICG